MITRMRDHYGVCTTTENFIVGTCATAAMVSALSNVAADPDARDWALAALEPAAALLMTYFQTLEIIDPAAHDALIRPLATVLERNINRDFIKMTITTTLKEANDPT